MTQRRSLYDDKDEKRSLAHLQATLDEEEEEYEEEHEDAPLGLSAPLAAPLTSPHEQSIEELTAEQIIARAESSEEWDIFEDIGAILVEKGDRVKYSVKLNGEHKGTIPHPCSYDWLQRKWGGGSYHVTLRSYLFSKKAGGGYLKSQSKMVADPLMDDRDEDAPLPTALAGVSPPPEKGPSSLELLGMLQTMTDKAKNEQKAEIDRLREENRLREDRLEKEAKSREERLERESKERESKRESESGSTMMMLMKFMEQSSVAAREAAQRQNEMLIALMTKQPPPEKEDKKTDKLFDMLLGTMLDKKSRGDSLDPLELQKLLAAAEDKGYSRAKEIRELAQEEAALMNSRHGGGKGGDDDEDEEPREEPKSTTKMLLETIAPMVTQFVQSAQASQAAQAQGMPSQRQPMPMRRPLPPPQQAGGVNPNLPARPATTSGAQTPTGLGSGARPATAPQEHPVKQAVQPAPPQRQTTNQVMSQTRPQAVGKSMKPSKKEIVAEVVTNAIGSDLSANILSGKFDPEGTADRCLASLKDHQVDAKWLLINFTLGDMKVVAAEKGIPDSVHPYLEAFYKRIEAEAFYKRIEAADAPANPS